MKKLLLAIFLFTCFNAHSATMWCLNDTMKCAHGTPPLSKLKLADRKAALYTLTVGDRNAAVEAGLFIPVTVNELIRLAKEYLKPPIVIPPPTCPDETTGTPPNCKPIVVIPEVCPEGQEGTPPNCTEIPVAPPVSILDGKTFCGNEWGWCNFGTNDPVTRQVWFGDANGLSLPKTVTGWGTQCERGLFEQTVAGNKCYIAPVGTTAPPVQTEPEVPPVDPNPDPPPVVNPPPHNHGLAPHVNTAFNMVPLVGSNTVDIKVATSQPIAGGVETAFRTQCRASHMSNDDPIVYPNQQGASHHHTIYGNTSVRYDSDLDNLPNEGNSTCNGGIANRTGYWVPSLIDTRESRPIVPWFINIYYKAGFSGDIKPFPVGLRMVAGRMEATPDDPQDEQQEIVRYMCNEVYTGRQNHFPATCSGDLLMMIQFPSCWDGVNLDSPNHKSHMAYPNGGSCPSTHPVKLPKVTQNVHWRVDDIKHFKLSSDAYDPKKPGGYSGHSDWVLGWDPAIMKSIIDKCLNSGKNCGQNLLGNGQELYHKGGQYEGGSVSVPFKP